MGRREKAQAKVEKLKEKSAKINAARDAQDKAAESHKTNFDSKTKKWVPKK